MLDHFSYILQNPDRIANLQDIYDENGYLVSVLSAFFRNFPITGYWINILMYGEISNELGSFDPKTTSRVYSHYDIYLPIEERLEYLCKDGYLTLCSDKAGVYTGDYSREQKRMDIVCKIDFVYSSYSSQYVLFENVREHIPKNILKKFDVEGTVRRKEKDNLFQKNLNLLWDNLTDTDEIAIYSLQPLGIMEV